MLAMKILTLRDFGGRVNPSDFWDWTLEERRKRASGKRKMMSFQEMADRAKRRGLKTNQSSIARSYYSGRKPSPFMAQVIAAAFDLPYPEVYKHAGIISSVPDWVYDDGRPSLLRAIKNMQQLSDEQIEFIILEQDAMIRQRRAALKGAGNVPTEQG